MKNSNRKMRLGLVLSTHSGSHRAAWRRPNSPTEKASKLAHFAETARKAEAAKMDFVFLADTNAAYLGTPEEQDRSRSGLMMGEVRQTLEPLTLLSAISVLTTNIGLVASATTTYNQPFTIARQFASLDHISGGRAAWNVVTSSNAAEAWNFSQAQHMEHQRRYERAQEFLEVVKKLWDSMEDGAYILNRAEGFFADEAKVHFINHQGPQFSVRGPLNVIRPPQGYPVIVQAGSSDQGIAFAGAAAEVVFTAQHSIDGARAFYAAIKSAATASGRRESDVLVMPGISLYVGDTKEAAERQREHLDSLIPSALGIHALSDLFGVDFSRYRLDDPLPTDLPATNRMIARANLMRETAARHNLTIRQVYQRLLGASGHLTVCGTVPEIADVMEEWFTTGAADGFNVSQPTVPEGIDDFVGLVIPELRRRGLVSSEYAGAMLRENLGLARPPNQYAS